MATLIWSKITNKPKGTRGIDVVKAAEPIFRLVNSALNDAIAARDWAELKATFDQHDVWYCTVNMPSHALAYDQAEAAGAFLDGREAFQCATIVAPPTVLRARGVTPSSAVPTRRVVAKPYILA